MDTKDRHIIAKFTDHEWRKIKSWCAIKGVSMAQWVREIALQQLNQSSNNKHGDG
jgi:hypothetical protein